MRHFYYLLAIFSLLILNPVQSQQSFGGYPKSFSKQILQTDFQKIELLADQTRLMSVDNKETGEVGPHEIGFTIPVDFTTQNAGTWYEVKEGEFVWKLEISSKNAEALAFYFNHFELPDDAELFLYNKSQTQLLGAFTSLNNTKDGLFATELIAGDDVIIEYSVSEKNKDINPFVISEVAYVYRDSGFNTLKGFNGSGACEVNINCVEGDNWQLQKQGVMRIQVKQGASLFWCSGSLINNTRLDFTPYVLTANHCGSSSSTADYAQWVFYFNYESETCADPTVEPDNTQSLTGSSLIANTLSGTSIGSDFKLLLLNDEVPESYEPYYNGWSRSTTASPSGVTIHHPSGDIKKISHYTSPLVSSNYDATTDNPNGLYWRVYWVATDNGWGVTEGGSSGSPIFNNNGLIVGSLTGGRAACSALTLPDYYGKFSYHWESNGLSDDRQLQPWLDPDNTGVETLSGLSYDDVLFIPEFTADTIVPVGGSTTFTDASVGMPNQWNWEFEGGIPGNSNLQTPPAVIYQTIGQYDVSLRISDGTRIETEVKSDYIKVVPVVGPTPATQGMIQVTLGTSPVSDVVLTLYDESGRQVMKKELAEPTEIYQFSLQHLSAGYYFLKVETPSSIDMYKVIML